MSYEVMYNKNGVLSLEIDWVVEAAYPNPSEAYFNFDVRTGKTIGINDVINDSLFEKFQAKVFSDKIDSLKEYTSSLKSQLAHKEIDSEAYQWAMEEIDSNCINSIDLSNFSLSQTGIKIIDPCEFPHAIRGLSPGYELRYSYRFLQPYLNPGFRHRLSN